MRAMNRLRGLLLAGGLLVGVVAGGTAWAANVTCTALVKCNGTNGADVLQGTGGQDWIFGMGGNDTLYGRGGSELLKGDTQVDTSLDGNDELYGGAGSDNLEGDGGSDLLVGGG